MPVPEPTPVRDPVSVAIVDSDFRVSHSEFVGNIAETHNLLGAEHDMGPAPVNHGTAVAALVGGHQYGYGRNVDLILIRASDRMDGLAFVQHLAAGITLAAERGARVVNASYPGGSLYLGDVAPFGGNEGGSALHNAVSTSNDGLGTAITVAAGNNSENLSHGWTGLHPHTGAQLRDTPWHAEWAVQEGDSILQKTIIVGGSTAGGRDRHHASAYPGHLDWVQERYLMAPYAATTASGTSDSATMTMAGTSAAAPAVAGMLSTLIHYWPHLDATESTGILLETADRSSHLYQSNQCGPNADINCGYYWHGQGFADLEAAVRPVGALSVPLGTQVDGRSVPLSATTLHLGRAWGDTLPASALEGLVAFDEYGRDYAASTDDLVHAGASATTQRVERLVLESPSQRMVTSQLGERFTLQAHLHPDGTSAGHHVSWNFDSGRIGAFRFEDGPETLTRRWAASEDGADLISDVHSGLLSDLGDGFGVTAAVGFNNGSALRLDYWKTNPADAKGPNGYRQELLETEVRVHPIDRLILSATYGRHREAGGFLGTRLPGTGAGKAELVLNRWGFGAEFALTPGAGLLARMERGAGQGTGDYLITAVDGIRSETMQIGLRVGDDEREALLILSRPLRVTGGTARLNVPIGRELDGTVVREKRAVNLRPSGSQTDLEFVYAFPLTGDVQAQFNLMHSFDAGQRSGIRETAFSASYRRRF